MIIYLLIISIIICLAIYIIYGRKVNESFSDQTTNYCGINGKDYVINVGSSTKNEKTIKLPNKDIIIYPNPINTQNNYSDVFSTNVKSNELTVKRLDSKGGWGQNLILRGCKPLYDNFAEVSKKHWNNINKYKDDKKYDNFIEYDNQENTNSNLLAQDKIHQLMNLLQKKKKYIYSNLSDDKETRNKSKQLLESTNLKMVQIENSIKIEKPIFKHNLCHHTKSNKKENQCFKYKKIDPKYGLIIAHISINISNNTYDGTKKLKEIYLNYNGEQASSIYYISRLQANDKDKNLKKGKSYKFDCYFNELEEKINGISFKVTNDSILIKNLHIRLTNPDNMTLLDKYFELNKNIKNSTYSLNFDETVKTTYQLTYMDNFSKMMEKLCKTRYNGYYTYTINIKGQTKKNRNLRVNYHFNINKMIYNTIQNITGDKITNSKVSGTVYGGYDKYTFIINPFDLSNLNFTYFSDRQIKEYQFQLYFGDNQIKITPSKEKYHEKKNIYEYLFKLNPDYKKCGL